ncbi:hypothetical protein DL764_007532 [Monosporascus ibericus]|uniref:DBF4-type domain-containing protein n=1 Tax=Monosporascus ibericus TaxID=155417 RepID=A0A4Q4T074_9PEZI|nr:hypothetical protein DL764_007532 [Monosporascus ibericus]
MSTASRRVPLSSNQNAANSPLRTSAAANANSYAAKQKRSIAQIQREEQYGQPPPAKKQMLDTNVTGTQRLLKSPSQQQPRVTKNQVVLQQKRHYAGASYENKVARERSGQTQQNHRHPVESAAAKITEKDVEGILNWQKHHRARFPNMVFFFDHVPEDTRRKLTKEIASLGAREEKFFSIDITHIVTTRTIPQQGDRASHHEENDANPEKKVDHHVPEQDQEQEQVQTINPSLLSRQSQPAVKRKLFDTELRNRKVPTQNQDDSFRRPKRITDVLLRARDMGKKIWPLDKLQRMLPLLLETDPYVSAAIAYGPRGAAAQSYESRETQDRNLLRLLHNERVNGPSDRDPTVVARELHYFKGPYIYVYDMEEKQKPIMVREYEKVADKSEGAWPQFRTAAMGRCPFVEDCEVRESRPRPKPKPQIRKPAVDPNPVSQQPEGSRLKPVTGKRTLSEMENAHSRNSSVASTEFMNPPKPVNGKIDFSANAFTGRPATGRMLGGEPVASGVQPSHVTSAIRSQMISSTAATPGLITGLSKEVHGLQRQVLKRNTSTTSQDPSSRRNVETSLRDDASVKRSFTLGRTSSRKLDMVDENGTSKGDAESKPVSHTEKRAERKAKKKDLKPGYCENCQEKYDDFDEHIDSKKHRRFADDPENWVELDDLLAQLERVSKRKPYSFRAPTPTSIYDEGF